MPSSPPSNTKPSAVSCEQRSEKPGPDADPAGECFYLDEHGRRRDDWIHEEMLDNPEAERLTQIAAARAAIARGMSREQALSLFGVLPLEEE